MSTSKLIFHLQEIPEGRSSKNLLLEPEDLELSGSAGLVNADLEIEFYKTDHFIQVRFKVHAEISLVCDRSLKPYTRTIEGSYQVFYEPGSVDETETGKGAVRSIPPELILNIEKDVRDTIMLGLPIRNIHPAFLDSEGIPKDFEIQSYGPGPDEDELTDPRWAALKKLKQN